MQTQPNRAAPKQDMMPEILEGIDKLGIEITLGPDQIEDVYGIEGLYGNPGPCGNPEPYGVNFVEDKAMAQGKEIPVSEVAEDIAWAERVAKLEEDNKMLREIVEYHRGMAEGIKAALELAFKTRNNGGQ